MKRFDIVIVGAGMAGASLAAEVAPHASVALLEAEHIPGYHATGRSAAFWTETYGGPGVQPLTTASGPFLTQPPQDFAEQGFLGARGALHLADPYGFEALEAFAEHFSHSGIDLRALEEADIGAYLPGLRDGLWRALLEPSTKDIDVAALHAAYLAAGRKAGVELFCSAPLRSAFREDGRWRIDAGDVLTIDADILVDAAGAWADQIARIAGASPLGIRPYRRTIAQLRTDPPAPETLPLVIDAAGRFYFKPETGRLWLSPHDETPVLAGDVAPEEIDIATAIDRLDHVVNWRVERVERAWAGLRSFAPDRLPVYGFAGADAPGFFWFAGQGGFGIQTAPAAAKLAAALLIGQPPHPMVAAIDAERYAPSRLRLS